MSDAELEFGQCFAASYASARSKFVAAASDAGAALAAFEHPSSHGPQGEKLTIDVAHFGDTRGARQLVVISGTHGQEGFAGSAMQIAWMRAGDAGALPPGVGVLMIHALNPYGFAHGSRTTENNVDLNRNFLDHDAGRYPENPGYGALHPVLLPEEWSRQSAARARERFERFRAEHGADALYNALMSGQYTHRDGLIFGGRQREWSNHRLEDIVDTFLASAQKVAFIDWHTGIGEYGQPFFLCFNDPDSSLFDMAAHWWGESAIKRARPHGLSRPAYSGLVFYGMQEFLGNRPMCGAVIEMGTRGQRMRRILQLDLWLRFCAQRGSEMYDMLRADMDDAFCPFDQEWRENVVDHGLTITRQAVAGLCSW